MAESYCGKSCAECVKMQSGSCPGCKAGPGRQFGGDCELAACCRSKGHEDCGTCVFKDSCPRFRDRERQPAYRQMLGEAVQKRQEEQTQRAALLGKWLWLLFWLFVPSVIAGGMANERLLGPAPGVYLAGMILTVVCEFSYGAILLKLAPEEDGYRIAGICALITAAVQLLILLLFGGAKAPDWSLFITLPASVAGLIWTCYEYKAHAAVLSDVDQTLSKKWLVLWKWYYRCVIALVVSMLAALFATTLSLILAFCSAVGLLVVRITALVYLYRTAKLFRRAAFSPSP